MVGVPVDDAGTKRALHAVYDDAPSRDRWRDRASSRACRARAAGARPQRRRRRAATSSYAREKFERDVERIKEYILAGDCFQVLLARRIEVPLDFDPRLALPRAARAEPVAVHVPPRARRRGARRQLARAPGARGERPASRCARSPARAPAAPRRSRTSALEAELLADEKERAEHVMLVDLGRNDVGRIAEFGTVRVTRPDGRRALLHVLHIVSQVEGTLRDGASAVDVFRATFPAGTMTGAPKVRAMEIIDELEPERRGAVRRRGGLHRRRRPAHGPRDHDPHLRHRQRRRLRAGWRRHRRRLGPLRASGRRRRTRRGQC